MRVLIVTADRNALLGAEDFFAHPWLDAAPHFQFP
jgi:hypothetical protein